jgi:hypothetical protein
MNAVALGEQFQGFIKTDALDLLHELDHVTRGAAAEALIKLVSGVDRERRRFFGVEGAQTHEAVRPRLAQAHAFAHYLDDIDRRLELIDEIHGGAARR